MTPPEFRFAWGEKKKKKNNSCFFFRPNVDHPKFTIFKIWHLPTYKKSQIPVLDRHPKICPSHRIRDPHPLNNFQKSPYSPTFKNPQPTKRPQSYLKSSKISHPYQHISNTFKVAQNLITER